METITYKFADGTESAVEVSDEFYSLYQDMEKADELSERKHTRRNQSLERSVDNGWDIADPDADVAVLYEIKERNERLYKAISTLTPEQQTLIKQVFFDRIPQVEIAEQQGTTKMALHNKLTRILRKLKKFCNNACTFAIFEAIR